MKTRDKVDYNSWLAMFDDAVVKLKACYDELEFS